MSTETQYYPNLTLITGRSGCGKSTIAEFICDYLAPTTIKQAQKYFVSKDVSACLNESRKHDTRAGRILKGMETLQTRGKVLDATPVVESIIENIAWLAEPSSVRHLFLPGSPRSVSEVMLWVNSRRSFDSVYIDCGDEGIVQKAIEQRRSDSERQGKVRADDACSGTMERKLIEFQEKVLPAIEATFKLPGKRMIRVSRTAPFTERVAQIVRYINIPDEVRQEWLAKLTQPEHPHYNHVHEGIHGIEKFVGVTTNPAEQQALLVRT